MRRSIFVRLLGVVMLVALCAIAATAWIAAQLTRGSLQQEQGREIAADNNIYSSLLGYAVGHPDWPEVRYVVKSLAEQYPHRRIVLLTEDRGLIADSGGDDRSLPERASARIDPLNIDPVLVPGAPADRIDKRVLGPFRTPIDFRESEDHTGTLECLRSNKRIAAEAPGSELKQCFDVRLPADTAADFQALIALEGLVESCLTRRGLPAAKLDPDYTPARGQQIPDEPAVAACVKSAREEQLAPYVPPAALLFVTSPGGTPATSFDLSPGNWWRIAGLAAAILVVAVIVTAFVYARLTRPLRVLTSAANNMATGSTTPPVPVRGRDEIAQLTTAFNTMVDNRERLEQARKAMVGDVAHELRTPLSNIRGWLEAAEDGLTERDPALIALLLNEALVLQQVVNDLQDLAEADAGMLRLDKEPVPVLSLVRHLIHAHRTRAEDKQIDLTVDVPGSLHVHADPIRLRQMLDNLVTNAIRHVPPGGSIAVTARPAGTFVDIEVADTGPGISPEDLPHVFDRFWRAERSRNRQTGGSGLGLAIVRKLAEAQGGTATASSTPGSGATFTLRLPHGNAGPGKLLPGPALSERD